YDDAYSPPKTVEQARKLVESDEVFLIFASLGTAPNAAIQKYMNNMKVPQLFVATGASRWGDPEHFPWTIGWQPNYRAEARVYATHIMTNVSQSVGAVLKPAGLDNSKGILTAQYQMDVTDPQWDSYPGMKRFRTFMAKYYPEADKSESGPLTAFNTSTALVEVLKRCGDNLTRENVMKVVANLDFEINTYIPGIRIKTSPTDFYPIEQVQMMKFTGEKWQLF